MRHLQSVRAWRRRLTIGMATTVVVGAAALVGTPLHAAAGVVVPPIPTVTIMTGGGGVGVPGTTNVTIYTLTLSASNTSPASGDTVTLTATASPNVPSNYHIDIDQYSQLAPPQINEMGTCYSSPCSVPFSNTSGQYTYQAYLDDSLNAQPPSPENLLAASNPVVVTWSSPTMPSTSDCPSTPTVSGDQAGITYMFNTASNATQTTVCFRIVDTLAGGAVGGALVVTPGGLPGTPTTLAGDRCLGQAGNDLTVLPHPLSSQKVNGQTIWYVDTYQGTASNGDYWVCLEAAGVAETVDIPVTIGGVVPGITFQPDPDSLVQ